MKKINVTYVCAADEEYPGCADLLYSYPEVEVIARSTSLVGTVIRPALSRSDVLVVDESVLTGDGLRAVHAVHTTFPGLNILMVYEKDKNINMMNYLSIGVRGLLERRSCLSLLRRAITALCAGEIWMPRTLLQSLRERSPVKIGRLSWEIHSTMMPDPGRMN
jgi:DNA-binding NarL/FixJ family response regulator